MTLAYQWEWRSKAPPAALWPFVSDTQRVNRAVGLAPWHFEAQAEKDGGSSRKGRARFLGLDVTWDEAPFEWRENETFSIERRYHNGPYAQIVTTVTLTPEDGGTKLTNRIECVPRGLFGRLVAPWHLGVQSYRGFDRVYRRLFEFAELRARDPFPEAPPELSPEAAERTERITRKLQETHDPALVAQLVDHVRTATDPELAQLRPFALAKRWKADRMDVLRLFLRATREGLLELSWRILCPHCRGAKDGVAMSQLRRDAHCSSCNFDFEAEFSQNVEITFTPAALVRKVEAATYCIGGPGNTPHIVVQKRVAPGASEELRLALAPGAYRIRSPQLSASQKLTVEAGGGARAEFGEDVERPGITVDSPFVLTLRNDGARERLFVVERTAWADDAATASIVTTCQDFRDLFSNEVLASGEELRVSLLAFLFTDLKNSTAMYEKIGDAPAFALVRSHFDVLEEAVKAHDGAIVKTIGDAVMAVFTDPVNAAKAARQMFDAIAAMPPGSEGQRLTLKVGLHAGACLAVNLNERLDYFGTTVNLAARVQGESVGGDLVLTRQVAEDPAVRAFLSAEGPRIEAFATKVKGLTDAIEMERVWFGERDAKAA